MKIINDGLPEPLYRAVCDQRQPDPSSLTVTKLIGPPQIQALMAKHWDELEELASDRVWLADGNAMHTLLEQHGQIPGFLTEHKLEAMVDGRLVSGTLDSYELATGTLTDYKRVGIATLYNGVKSEWEQQLNCYAHFLRIAGYEVQRAEVCVIYRDWIRSRAVSHDYPQKPVERVPVALWPDAQVAAFLQSRVELHSSETPPPCTAEERWERKTTYAVYNGSAARALRVFDSWAEADAWLHTQPPAKAASMSIQIRAGANVRCESYCSVAKFCPQWAALKAAAP